MAESNMQSGVRAGASNLSWSIVLRRTSDSLEHTGLVAANMTLAYWRQGSSPVLVPALDLANLTSLFTPGGVKEVDPVNMRGAYRIDWPNAAWADGADWVHLTVEVAGDYAFNERVPLTVAAPTISTGPGTITGAGPIRVLDLLTAALVGIRVHRMAAPLPPEMAQHALDTLNLLLDAWTADGRTVYRWQELTTPLIGATSYTIGPGGVLNTNRPFDLQDGFTRIEGNDYPYTVLTQAVYNAIGWKGQAGFTPVYVWYDAAFPLGLVYPWPPTTGGVLHVFLEQPFTSVALNDALALPVGYVDALVYALGRREASTYGQQLDALYLEEARKAETSLRRRAHKPQYASIRMPAGRMPSDDTWIYTGGLG